METYEVYDVLISEQLEDTIAAEEEKVVSPCVQLHCAEVRNRGDLWGGWRGGCGFVCKSLRTGQEQKRQACH